MTRFRVWGAALGIPRAEEGLARSATQYAQALHRGQVRSADGAPFIRHPREVAALLRRAGAPDHVVAAGVLHDVLEKTPARVSELRERFGPRVTNLVLAVTDDARIRSYAARKAALREQLLGAGEEALAILAADKVSKVRELRLERRASRGTRRGGCGVRRRRERLAHYRACQALLLERLPSSPLVALLGAELDRVSARG